jgi:TetR/AcrR family transcriptional regulator, regulator of autoinduction and epiphytic fitness
LDVNTGAAVPTHDPDARRVDPTHGPAAEPPVPVDGRVARSRRTVEHIVGALLELVERDGHLRPTAHQVARRAGVSRRGLYLHFETLEDLFAAAAERRSHEVQATWEPPPATTTLSERIDWFCQRWTTLLEDLNPVRRAAAMHEPFSYRVAAGLEHTRRWARATVERTFDRELVSLPEPERRPLVTALHHATSWSAWDDLRRHGYDVHEASEALRRVLTALLHPVVRVKEGALVDL